MILFLGCFMLPRISDPGGIRLPLQETCFRLFRDPKSDLRRKLFRIIILFLFCDRPMHSREVVFVRSLRQLNTDLGGYLPKRFGNDAELSH